MCCDSSVFYDMVVTLGTECLQWQPSSNHLPVCDAEARAIGFNSAIESAITAADLNLPIHE